MDETSRVGGEALPDSDRAELPQTLHQALRAGDGGIIMIRAAYLARICRAAIGKQASDPTPALTDEQLQTLEDHPIFGRMPNDMHWFPLSRGDTSKPTIFAQAVAEIRRLRAALAVSPQPLVSEPDRFEPKDEVLIRTALAHFGSTYTNSLEDRNRAWAIHQVMRQEVAAPALGARDK